MAEAAEAQRIADRETQREARRAERTRQAEMVAAHMCPTPVEMAVWTPEDVRTSAAEHGCQLMCPSRRDQRWINRNIRGGLERMEENGCRITQRFRPAGSANDDPVIIVGPSGTGTIPMGGGMSMGIY